MYGNVLLERHFLLRAGLVNFNHGSFGTVPKEVMNKHTEFLHEQEAFPDLWFRESYYPYQDTSRALIAKLINANIDDVVLVENASYAVNSVLRSFPFQHGDRVLVLSSAYRMVLDTLRFLHQHIGIESVVVDIPFPLINEHEIIDAVAAVLKSTDSIKMCIFSHISSMVSISFKMIVYSYSVLLLHCIAYFD
jgi:selenocysteine lyase/cysteine desulfurase